MNLDTTLDNIGRKYGIVPVDNDTKSKPRTPTPTHKSVCTSCNNGPALVDSLCEPCYRRTYVAGLFEIRDRLFKQLSDLDMKLVRHEAALKNAKQQYALAEKQNWACKRCKKIFSYFGDLYEHEQSKGCDTVRTTPAQRRASRRDEDIA